MSFNWKKSLIIAIGILGVSTLASTIIACVNQDKKAPIQEGATKQNTKEQNIREREREGGTKKQIQSEQSKSLLISNLENELIFVNNKHSLKFKVNKPYHNKYILVELKSSNNQTFESNKTQINNDGLAVVSFSNLTQNSEYLINKIFIFNQKNDSKPILSKTNGLNQKLKTNKQETAKQQYNNTNQINNQINSSLSRPPFNKKYHPQEFLPKTNFDPQNLKIKPTVEFPTLLMDEQKIYNKLKDRTFAIAFNSNDAISKNDKGELFIPYTQPMGTAWLLDYAWKNNDQKSGEVMLFLATNAHVYKRAFNTLDEKYKTQFPEYFTQDEQKMAKIHSFTLGVPETNSKVDPINNNYKYKYGNKAIYFINEKLDNPLKGKVIHTEADGIYENPKTVFVALNIFDEQTNDEWKKKALLKPDPKKYNRIVLGKDFAVFGLKVNLNKIKEKTDPTNKEWPQFLPLYEQIQKAMKALNEDIKEYSTSIKKYPNHDQSKLPYASFDYPSLYLEEKNIDKNIFELDKYNTSPNSNKMFVVGFPGVNGPQYLWRNNPKDITTPKNWFNYEMFTNLFSSERILDEKTGTAPYGYGITLINSSIWGGSSGSLVANEYGLPVGIFYATEHGEMFDVSRKGHFLSFVQIADSPIYGPRHNLIDGSDKKKFPKQIKSYRENLRVLSKDNGPFAGYSKTALFPEGA